ncbi:hypothetical protein AB0958_19040 [Streptomyces sp. NPDC006655]|uniref:hypothetical protein n=1 Tax=Streptomyces sp. NPDC006655 TaxID=3156898 RepID=UPI00345541F2
MSRGHACKYCTDTTVERPVEKTLTSPVELPTEPRRFRVHLVERPHLDCTLHPDGMVTTVMAGQLWRCAFSFDEMRTGDWATAGIEWDPDPLADDTPPPPEPTAMQDALI